MLFRIPDAAQHPPDRPSDTELHRPALAGPEAAIADISRVHQEPHPTQTMEPGQAIWKGLAEGLRDGFFFAYDADGLLRYLSPAAEHVLGRSIPSLLAEPAIGLLGRSVGEEEPKSWLSVQGPGCDLYRVARDDGSIVELAVRSYPVAAAGGCTWTGGYAQDVTRQLELQRRLSHDATHDPLTGLPNRTLFDSRLRQVVARRGREIGARFALLMLDLDGFKEVNDTHGHLVGDRLLQNVADRLARSIRPADTVCRCGGDEFIILIEEVGRIADAVGVAARILEALSHPFDLGAEVVRTSASVGILEGEMGTDTPEELVRAVDAAMYRAKRLGRNRYIVAREVAGSTTTGSVGTQSPRSPP